MRLSTLKWRLKEVVHMSRGLWCWEEFRLAQQMAELDKDIYEVRTPQGAAQLDIKWPGYPFVIYGDAHYGKYDLYSHCFMWFWWTLYIMSGEYQNDMGRAEDEQLLAYARG